MAGRLDVRRCFALLIDNRKFLSNSGLPSRIGAERDLHNIRAFCETAGFTLYEGLGTNNLTLVQIRQLLQDILRQSFSEYDAFALFISSHGIKGEIRTTDGGTITVQEIVSAFEEKAELQDKPKLFFVNNCLDEVIFERDKARPVVPIYVPMAYNVLIANASVDGYEYPRDAEEGSFAVRVLGETLQNHESDSSLTEALHITLQEAYNNSPLGGSRRQIPSYISTLIKSVYFIRPVP